MLYFSCTTKDQMYGINFFFFSPALQNKTKENSPTGSSVPLHDPSFDYSSHQLHDLQPGSTVCHVRKPEVPCAGEGQCWWQVTISNLFQAGSGQALTLS